MMFMAFFFIHISMWSIPIPSIIYLFIYLIRRSGLNSHFSSWVSAADVPFHILYFTPLHFFYFFFSPSLHKSSVCKDNLEFYCILAVLPNFMPSSALANTLLSKSIVLLIKRLDKSQATWISDRSASFVFG